MQSSQQEEKKTNDTVEPYLRCALKNKQECNKLLQFDAPWIYQSQFDLKYKFENGQIVNINTKLSYISVKRQPTIWLTDYISCLDCKGITHLWFRDRMKWDDGLMEYSHHSLNKNSQCDDNLFILHHKAKSIGNIISQRDFVDIVKIDDLGNNKIFISRSEISHPAFSTIKGFVRGSIIVCGVMIEQLDKVEMEKYKLPSKIESVSNIKWCRVRCISQMDYKGWVPSSLIDSSMAAGAKILGNNSLIYAFKQYGLKVQKI